MSNLKTSLLVNYQVPEFVQEEHPLFISFLEAYYEYLETKQGSQINDLTSKSKDLRHLSDVDASIAEFENSFFNSYADLIPRNVEVDKAFLIKHILPLYLAKGNQKSFQLLFRLLFNEEVEVVQPNQNILRASDGKWLIENAFRISQNVYSKYTGNGTKTTFKLIQVADPETIAVYVNGVLKTLATDYYVRKESRKLIFNSAPANNSEIKVLYNNFDFEILTNRKLTGSSSFATALVERVSQKTVNTVPIFELYVNRKTLIGEFITGENATLDIVDPDDKSLIQIEVLGLASLRTINIINGGASYNVGDPVTITGGNPTNPATAVISEVFSGFINKIQALAGGAGFKVGSNVYVVGTGAASLTLAIDGVDVSGQNTANVFVVNTDRIADYGSIAINAADYGFNASIVTENVNSKIIDALSFQNVTSIGAITNVAILFANAAFASIPTLDADSAPFQANGTTHQVLSTYSLGRIEINSGGSGYAIGDELLFTQKSMTFGIGGAAAVTNVSSIGAITKVELQPSRIRGTANTFGTTNVTVIGTNTVFEDDLRVGDRIMVNNEPRYINSISSNTSLNVNVNFNYATTNKRIGKFGDYPIGGQNYDARKLPTITISSTAGSNANLTVSALMGDGENLLAQSDKNPGAILKIRITDAGEGYEFAPQISLTAYGDGTATANTEIEPSYVTFPGRWTTSDSLLSSSERVIQGREYYVDYSYLLSSSVEFSKFKDVFKDLIHPAGFIDYAEYKINETIDTTIDKTALNVANTIAGTVNVNNSIYITGINTNFVLAQTLGIISVGTKVAVNTEIGYISEIVSSTSIIVGSPFSQIANLQEMIILSDVEPLLLFTEGSLPITTESNELITL
ncbi:MAG: hypothetical protein ACOYNN_13340 [Terrimicrobiaceae bacterium]